MTTPQIRVRNVAELVTTLPHQFGYTPQDSLVMVFLGEAMASPASARPAGQIQMMCRLDLPFDLVTRSQLVAAASEILRRERPATVCLLAYESGTDVTETLHAVGRACEAGGARLGGAARVRGQRWLSVNGSGEWADWAEGGEEKQGVWRQLPSADTVPAVAELVFLGRQPGLGRSELAARLRGDPARRPELLAELDDYADSFLAVLRRSRSRDGATGRVADDRRYSASQRFVERGARAWSRILDCSQAGVPVGDLPPAVLVHGLAMLWDRGFRDALITWITPGQLGPGMLSAEVLSTLVRHLSPSRLDDLGRLDRLVDLCGVVPEEFAVPVLTVTAQCAWALNRGTLANLAIERALEGDPDYYLARLLDQVLQHGVRPPLGPFTPQAV